LGGYLIGLNSSLQNIFKQPHIKPPSLLV